MDIMEIFSENKGAIAFALLVMLAGSAAYFAAGDRMMFAASDKADKDVFKDMLIKVAYGQDGTMHLLAWARNNALATLKAREGNPIPEEDSAVFGSSEAAAYMGQGRFYKPGERVGGFFGLSTVVEGILQKTDTPIDEMTFLSGKGFSRSSGEEGRVYSRISESGRPWLIYRLMLNDTPPSGFILSEGSMSGYRIHDLDGKQYYPILIGAREAKRLREEKVFTKTGDPIRGFHGRNFVVAGILKETNTSIDVMHFIPLYDNELVD